MSRSRYHETAIVSDSDDDSIDVVGQSLVVNEFGTTRLTGGLEVPTKRWGAWAFTTAAWKGWKVSTPRLCLGFIFGIALRCFLVWLTWDQFRGTMFARIMENEQIFYVLTLMALALLLASLGEALVHRSQVLEHVAKFEAGCATLRALGMDNPFANTTNGGSDALASAAYITIVTVLRRQNKVDNNGVSRDFFAAMSKFVRSPLQAKFAALPPEAMAAGVGPLENCLVAIKSLEIHLLSSFGTSMSSHVAVVLLLYFSVVPAHFVEEFGLYTMIIVTGLAFILTGLIVMAQLIRNPFSSRTSDAMNQDVWAPIATIELSATAALLTKIKTWTLQCVGSV